MQSIIYYIEIWSRLRFETVYENMSKFDVRGCMAYALEPNFQKYVVKSPK